MGKDSIFLDPDIVKKQKEAEEKYQREKKLRISDLRKVLSTPEGRRTIWNELVRAKVFAPSFSLNSIQMGFNEGERAVGIALLTDLMEAKPEAFYQMWSENYANEQSTKKQEEQENDRTNQD